MRTDRSALDKGALFAALRLDPSQFDAALAGAGQAGAAFTTLLRSGRAADQFRAERAVFAPRTTAAPANADAAAMGVHAFGSAVKAATTMMLALSGALAGAVSRMAGADATEGAPAGADSAAGALAAPVTGTAAPAGAPAGADSAAGALAAPVTGTDSAAGALAAQIAGADSAAGAYTKMAGTLSAKAAITTAARAALAAGGRRTSSSAPAADVSPASALPTAGMAPGAGVWPAGSPAVAAVPAAEMAPGTRVSPAAAPGMSPAGIAARLHPEEIALRMSPAAHAVLSSPALMAARMGGQQTDSPAALAPGPWRAAQAPAGIGVRAGEEQADAPAGLLAALAAIGRGLPVLKAPGLWATGAPHGAAARGAAAAQTGERPGGQGVPSSGAGQPAAAEQPGAPEWHPPLLAPPAGPQAGSDAAPAPPPADRGAPAPAPGLRWPVPAPAGTGRRTGEQQADAPAGFLALFAALLREGYAPKDPGWMVAGAPHVAAAQGAAPAQTGKRPGGQDAPPNGAGQPAAVEQPGAPEWHPPLLAPPAGPQAGSDAAPAPPPADPGAPAPAPGLRWPAQAPTGTGRRTGEQQADAPVGFLALFAGLLREGYASKDSGWMVAGAPHGAAARGAPSAQTGQRPGGQDAPPSGAGQPAPAEQHGAPEWYRTKRCHPDGPQPASDAAPAGPAGVPGAAESVGADVSDNFRKAMQVLANPPYTVVLNESSVKALKALVGSGSVGEQKPPAGEGAEKEGAKGEPPAAPTVADLEATVSRLTTELERVGNEARMLEYSRGNPSSLDQTRPGAGYVMDPLREQMDRARAREADITRKLTEAQAALAKARNEAAAKDAKGIGEGLLASENALAKAEGKRGTQEELADAEAAKRAAEVALENAGSSAGEALRQKLQTAVNTATVQVANLKAQLAKEGVERVAKAMPEWEKHWKRWGDRLWNIPRDRQAMEKYAKAFWEEFNTKAFGEQTRAKAFAKMWKGLTLKGADGKPAPLSGALQSVGDWAGRVGVDVLGTMGIRLRTERRKGEVGTPRDLRRAGAVMSALPVIASTAAGIGQAPDKKTGAMTGAMGLASAGWMVGMQWGKTAGLYGAVAGAVIGGVAGLLFGGNEARKQAEREAQRMRAAQLEELRRINNSLAPVSDYFRGMSLNLLPPSMTFGGGGVAQSYAVISQRGARA